jgi:hypothetical protein
MLCFKRVSKVSICGNAGQVRLDKGGTEPAGVCIEVWGGGGSGVILLL